MNVPFHSTSFIVQLRDAQLFSGGGGRERKEGWSSEPP